MATKKTNQKNERTFKGTSYNGLQATETAKTKSLQTGKPTQADAFQNLDQIISDAWNKVKSKKYIHLNVYNDYRPDFQSNLNNGVITKLQFSNGLQIVMIPIKDCHEQSGISRYKGRAYCPQVDLHLGTDSITTFIKKCESFESKCKKKGIL
jgi:hypothetical protein